MFRPMSSIVIKSSKLLVEEARSQIKNFKASDAIKFCNKKNYIFIDLRDVRELQKLGKIKNSIHVPRGMLEFWIDPLSPYYKKFFGKNCNFIFYCASGWRSALSTLTAQQMGLKNVSHIVDGYNKWLEINGPIEKIN